MGDVSSATSFVGKVFDVLSVGALMALSAAVAFVSIRGKKKEPEHRRINRP